MDRPGRVALIELFERDGRSGRVLDVHAWPLTLGRALDNDVVLDDPHVAPQHLRLAAAEPGGAGIVLEVLDTDNGVLWGRRKLGRGARAELPAEGAELQLGGTRLRLRLPGETLAPEVPLPPRPAWPLASGALLAALLLFVHWLSLDPGADAAAWLPAVAGIPVLLAGWCGAWALLSKLFQHRFEFVPHLRIALPWLLAIELVDSLWPLLATTLAAPLLWHLGPPLQVLLLALMVRRHLVQVLPAHPRVLTAVVAAATLAGSAVSLLMTHRSTDRLVRAPYMSTLPLPGLHLDSPASSQAVLERMAPLQAVLAERTARARREDADNELDDGGDETEE